MVASSATEIVRTLGKYALFEKLGEGHLGPVYRGIDQECDRAVAIRVLCDGIKWDAKVEELFQRECRSVATLNHRNIAVIYEVGKEGQCPYIVMESLGSGSIKSLIAKKSAIPVETKLSIIIQAAEGLSYAHKNGVLHRDLGPAKIHVMPDGTVKIRDFAITHVLKKYLPHPVVRWGAPIYLSPEQIQQKDGDARSDIFSLGTIFYELITCNHPFHDPNGNKALDNIVLDVQIPTFEEFPDAPPGVWTILKTCLARDPNDRYRSMDELSNACRNLLTSMADDTQLMLAELYASITPLKKAAAQRGASEGIRSLLWEIEQLSRGARKADYASLDHLTAALIEHYPAIQAAASLPDPECRQPLSAEENLIVPLNAKPLLQDKPINKTDVSPSLEPGPPIPNSSDTLLRRLFNTPAAPADEEKPVAAKASGEEAPLLPPEESNVKAEPQSDGKALPASRNRKIVRPSYRAAAVLLAVLVLAAAGYIALRTEVPEPVRGAWQNLLMNSRTKWQAFIQNPGSIFTFPSAEQKDPEGSDPGTATILVKEARALAAENRFTESRVLIGRVLEANPSDEAALAALKEIDERSTKMNASASQIPQALLARVTAMIDSGKLQPARSEIDRLQQSYPEAPEILTLRRKWQARNYKEIRQQQQIRKEEEQQQKAVQGTTDEEWNRRLTELFAGGKYSEAANAVNFWLEEHSGSPGAQEFSGKIEEAQRSLKAYSSAMAENRYQDALVALRSMEKANPTDPNIAEMRRQMETRKTTARASLTVHRLGGKTTLLLDGKPIGNDGEVENESIPIGSHTLTIENAGGLIASRSQEYTEGQRLALVYDLAKLNLRPMADSDRELLAQRKAKEEVYRFSVEHDHGALRGSCRGMLVVDYLDVAYKPSSGEHGFRIPFKLLKLRSDGTLAELSYISDNKHFQSFKFQDEQAAGKVKRIWGDLKSLQR